MNSGKNELNNADDSKIKEMFEKARSKEPEFSLRGSLHEINNFNFMNPDNRFLISSLCMAMLLVIYAFGEFFIGEELKISLSQLFFGGFRTSVLIGLFIGIAGALWELALVKRETAFVLKFHQTDIKKRIFSFELQKKNFALNFWLILIISALPLFLIKYEIAIFPAIFALNVPMALINGEIRKFHEKISSLNNNLSVEPSVSISSFAPASSSAGASITSSGVSDGFGFWDAFLYFSVLLAFLSVIYCFNVLLPRPDTLLERSLADSGFREPGNIQRYECYSPSVIAASFSAFMIIFSIILSFAMTLFSVAAVKLIKGDISGDGKLK